MKNNNYNFYLYHTFLYSLLLLVISLCFAFEMVSIQIGIINYMVGIFSMCYLYHFLFYLPSRIFHKYLYYFLLLGIICKVLLSFSKPLWEDDWSRYLWEGNLLGYGISPYSNSPDFFFKDGSLTNLVEKETEILSRINHPDWASIYSPVVLLYFYLCSLVAPFSLIILKLGFIGLDVVVFWIIKSIRNKKNAILFFLFPVLLKEIYINAHFEMIPIFFFSISLWFHKKSYRNISSFFYGITVHSKLYLLVIFPFFFIRNIIDFKNKKIIRKSILPFIAYVLVGIFLPVVIFELVVQNNSVYGLDSLLKFSNEFEFNSIYFYILKLLFNFETAKKLVLVLLSIVSIYSVLNVEKYFINFNNGIVWCYTVFLFSLLFSPIVNPWYFLIVVPLYFITNVRLPFILLLVLFPQLSYLTKVNLKLKENQYSGFYTLEENIVLLEIVCITMTILLTILNRKKKP